MIDCPGVIREITLSDDQIDAFKVVRDSDEHGEFGVTGQSVSDRLDIPLHLAYSRLAILEAKATVTMELNCKSVWGDSTTVKQVRDQAIQDVNKELKRLSENSDREIKFVGQPEITVVTF